MTSLFSAPLSWHHSRLNGSKSPPTKCCRISCFRLMAAPELSKLSLDRMIYASACSTSRRHNRGREGPWCLKSEKKLRKSTNDDNNFIKTIYLKIFKNFCTASCPIFSNHLLCILMASLEPKTSCFRWISIPSTFTADRIRTASPHVLLSRSKF